MLLCPYFTLELEAWRETVYLDWIWEQNTELLNLYLLFFWHRAIQQDKLSSQMFLS